MAHFAEIDENNIVIRVVVVNNDVIQIDGNEIESVGIEFCQNLFGGKWIQTSYNGNFRRRYAQPWFVYDSVLDAFIGPKPYPSWDVLSGDGDWQPPVPKPTDAPEKGFVWAWQESTLSWVQLKIKESENK